MSFVDPKWRESLQALLKALDARLGQAPASSGARQPGETDVLAICSEMSRGAYRPGTWTLPGGTAGWNSPPPSLQPQTKYDVILLDVLDPLSRHYSMRSGGILLEDPFYAVLACYSVGYLRRLLCLPAVTNWQQAWARREQIVQSIAAAKYDAEEWFIECRQRGEIDQPRPEFLSLSGAVLDRFRESGLGELPTPQGPTKYALYFFR
jgi:hypothetical protein